MIKLEKIEVVGWEPAIRGMRNPMNSWKKSDSVFNIENIGENGTTCYCGRKLNGEYGDLWENPNESCKTQYDILDKVIIGPNDKDLMLRLNKGGPVEAKYRRMIVVYTDITAPLYWWKEFDTYKVGTVANSCSTMHKIHAKEFEIGDFSTEHLCDGTKKYLEETIGILNFYREVYNSFDEKSSDPNWLKSFVKDYGLQTKKDIWWQMIQLLPSSYNQKRTVMLNYEVLANIYPKRKNHKLDEWHTFCDWIKTLPLSEIITGEEKKDGE